MSIIGYWAQAPDEDTPSYIYPPELAEEIKKGIYQITTNQAIVQTDSTQTVTVRLFQDEFYAEFKTSTLDRFDRRTSIGIIGQLTSPPEADWVETLAGEIQPQLADFAKQSKRPLSEEEVRTALEAFQSTMKQAVEDEKKREKGSGYLRRFGRMWNHTRTRARQRLLYLTLLLLLVLVLVLTVLLQNRSDRNNMQEPEKSVEVPRP